MPRFAANLSMMFTEVPFLDGDADHVENRRAVLDAGKRSDERSEINQRDFHEERPAITA